MALSTIDLRKEELVLTIDCGTTNSRVYLVNPKGEILLWKSRKVGVKDTAIRGSNAFLKKELKALTDEVLATAGLSKTQIRLVISSGMITSELGLIELPHLFAPVSMDDLAGSITRVDGEESFDPELPLYLIRGIKNPYHPERNDLAELAHLDFMRGEETQVAGLLQLYGSGISTTVINLSSHTKCIPIDQRDRILGSVTTLSGQVFEALVKETFIGKSIASTENTGEPPASGELAAIRQAAGDLPSAGKPSASGEPPSIEQKAGELPSMSEAPTSGGGAAGGQPAGALPSAGEPPATPAPPAPAKLSIQLDESPPFDPVIADLAYEIVGEAGLLRGFVMPRFMDVLLRTTWQERRKFVESALAVDDLHALKLFPKFHFPYGERIFLIGPKARCEIFDYYLTRKLQIPATIRSISDPAEISLLAVQGALYLVRKRGLL